MGNFVERVMGVEVARRDGPNRGGSEIAEDGFGGQVGDTTADAWKHQRRKRLQRSVSEWDFSCYTVSMKLVKK